MKKYARMIVLATMLLMLLIVLVLPCTALAEGAPVPAEPIDLTPMVNAAIALIGAIFVGKIVPYLKERMTASQYERLEAAVRVAVYAAEEVYQSGHGDEKLNYAKAYLKRHGYDVDVDQIKAAVKQMRDGEFPAVEIEGSVEVSDEDDPEAQT